MDENSSKRTEHLSKIQQSSLKLLRVFDSYCRARKIRYYVAGGTLLGAIRHKGFVPWDDDVDVMLLRSEYERLKQAMREMPPSGYYWEEADNEKHPTTIHLHGKLCEIEASFESTENTQFKYGLDVFALDYVPKTKLAAIKQRLLGSYYKHLLPLIFGGTSSNYRVLKAVLRKFLGIFHREAKKIVASYMSAVINEQPSKWLYSASGIYGYRRERFASEWFSEDREVTFEEFCVPVPSGAEEWLRAQYGNDFMVAKRTKSRAHYRSKIDGISLVLATKGRVKEVGEFLRSINSPKLPIQIIVADQNEDDRLKDLVAKFANKFDINHIKLPPIGVSASRNAVLRHIKYQLVAFPDDDCTYMGDTLERMAAVFAEHPEVDIVLGGGQHNGFVGKYRLFHHGEMYLQFYRLEAVKTIGEFDIELGPGAKTDTCFGGDDSDYLARGAIAGLLIWRDKSIRVFHPPQDTASFSREKIIGYGRTRMAVLKKNSYSRWFRLLNVVFPLVRMIQFPCKFPYYAAMFKGRLSLRKKGIL